mmetsp:Transcript_31559/g.30871  ORF Transcript_31559/g.30871 Transcript_31559/m.30871 type:complete len:82 (+) Transcript_31559:598-843(+)|eukprot:CAMPEP_0170562736 /NCGR_PEP_ID=MMETSP0211-20121228/62225_1 /TAXON_ID=311385 /ORGANISM="Pseudokeronopsis sp., Strain OXSARD2" /LENGTH=81 /DNA_ID=CAMNT_0010880025 /DNA_START=528 /DNA_END=773 /DNA_ORIENTATION=-
MGEQIEMDSKKNLRPGPGTYNELKKSKLIGSYQYKEEKSLYIEEARQHSLGIPAPYTCQYNLVEKRVPQWSVPKPKVSAKE